MNTAQETSSAADRQFPAERQNGREVFPSPAAHEICRQTPPAFVWLPLPCDDGASVDYTLTVCRADQTPVLSVSVRGNTYLPAEPFAPGDYLWNVAAPAYAAERGAVPFTVAEDAVVFSAPSAAEVLAGIPDERPRHLFTYAERGAVLAKHPEEAEVLRRNIARAYEDGLPERPYFHLEDMPEGALPYREYFGRFRDFCDRNLVACALGYVLFDDLQAGAFAKKLFLHICGWNPNGPCSLCGPWGDEVGLSCARCFPAVFDMLYPLLNPKERQFAGETVALYALQCQARLGRLNYFRNPGDSHAGRLPAYLGEAAISLHGTGLVPESVLETWLDTALRIYGGMFPYFGQPDGGWAEGTFYSTSYTKWYLPFFSAAARFSGKSFLVRPFYRRYARFLLHFALPDHEIHPFGDGYWCSPESPEWPGFYAQNPFRTYAEVSGLADAVRLERELAAPPLFSLHLLDIFLPEQKIDVPPVPEVTDADAFPEAGFVSLHSDRTHPETDLHLIAHATKFGPGSHRQPDQGSFALFCGGTALLSPSGYFGRGYGSAHHMGWMNTTKAHNTVLIDGAGQDYRNFRLTGRIVFCGIRDGVRETVLDLSAAYPMLRRFVRTLRMPNAHTVTLCDEIEADTPVAVTEPFHMLSAPEASGGGFTLCRGGFRLRCEPEADAFVRMTCDDRFGVDLNEGVPAPYQVTMPPQFHVYFETEKRSSHRICMTFRTERSQM